MGECSLQNLVQMQYSCMLRRRRNESLQSARYSLHSHRVIKKAFRHEEAAR